MGKTIFEDLGGTYTEVGEVFIPDLELSTTDTACLGKWGRMRKRCLKEHRPALFSSMLLSGTLDEHLSEIDRAAEDWLELITRQMVEREGVTEALKAADQMEWVRRMNSIRSRAEEVVMSELIYAE